MRIYATSDWHGYLPEIPECDILILAGDYERNRRNPGYDLLGKHLAASPVAYVVMVGGNHDFGLQDEPQATLGLLRKHLAHTLIYLEDGTIDLHGVRIHGTPFTPPFYNWAFMLPEDQLANRFAYIPDNIDILVTHGPAHGTLDLNIQGQHCGSTALKDRIEQAKPKVHIFGHIHEQGGKHKLLDGTTDCYNVSLVNYHYVPVNSVKKIILNGSQSVSKQRATGEANKNLELYKEALANCKKWL